MANGLLLFAIYRDPLRCFHNPTTIFVLNLTVSDLLNNCINFSELFLSLTNIGGVHGLPKLLGKIVHSTFDCLFFSTFPFVFSMAVERYLAISRPLWHKVYVTRRFCGYWTVALWLINFGYSGISIALRNSNLEQIYETVVQSCIYMSFYFGTIVMYFLAFLSLLRRQRQTIENITSEVTRQTAEVRLKNQSHFLKTILIVNLILIFGLLPTMYYYIVFYLFHDVTDEYFFTSKQSIGMELLHIGLDLFNLVNYAINPFLYFVRLQKYGKTFLILYWKKAL